MPSSIDLPRGYWRPSSGLLQKDEWLMVNVICEDFDGTLIDRQHRIHPADIALLEGDSEVLFIPSTGRPLHALRHAFNEVGLFTNCKIPLPLVLQNGALTFFHEEVVCEYRTFPLPVQSELVMLAQRHEHLPFFFSGFDTTELVNPSPVADRHVARFQLKAHPLIPGPVQQPFCRMFTASDDQEALDAVVADTAHLPVDPVFSVPLVLEILISGVNKGLAARRLVERMGLGDARLFAIGDGENDRDLFAVADRVFVPSDAPENIRARADVIIDRSPEGILAPVIRAFNEG
jgi:HAD superfamily hydrolase (TIGR01484 family)